MIRKAENEDVLSVEELYLAVLRFEQEHGNYTNWQKGVYPTRQTAEEALREGTLYVGEENGKLWGTMILNDRQLECYREGKWQCRTDKVLVIHTMCIHPEARKCGRADQLLNYADEVARQEKKEAIRLDTYAGNLPANRMYQNRSYYFAGAVETLFLNGEWETLNLYEKRMI